MLKSVLFFATLIVLGQAAFTVDPSPAVEQAPFKLTSTDPSVASIFLSTTSDCGSSVGTVQFLDGTKSATFAFAENYTLLHICDGTLGVRLDQVAFQSITFEPKFLFRAIPSMITFSSNTPAFSRVTIGEYGDCVTGTPVFDSYLSTNYELTATINTAIYFFVCVHFTGVNGLTVRINLGTVVVTEEVRYSPNVTTYGETAVFETGGAAPPNGRALISSKSDCSLAVTSILNAAGDFGRTVALYVTIPRGMYDFCVETPLNSGLFVSAGKLLVLQYGATPQTVFVNRATTFTLTDDSPPDTKVVLTQLASCQAPFLIGPNVPTNGQFTWTVVSEGVYYICVQKSNSVTYVRAGNLTVVMSYTLTIQSEPVVVGIPNLITIPNHYAMTVVFAQNSDCTSPKFNITTSNFKSDFTIADATPPTLMVCIQTPDQTAIYSIRTINVRGFLTTYPSLVVGKPIDFNLDPMATDGTYFYFSASGCNQQGSPNVFAVPSSKLIQTYFNTSGQHDLCYHALGVFMTVTKVHVYPVATASPLSTIAHFPLTIQVDNFSIGTSLTIGDNCSHSMVSSSTGTLDVTFPQSGIYSVCILLPNSIGITEANEVNTIDVKFITHSPIFHSVGKPSTFRFLGTTSAIDHLLANKTVFFSTVSTCVTRASSSWVVQQVQQVSSIYFTHGTIGSFYVCITIEPGKHLSTGGINIIMPLNVTFSTNDQFVSAPFTFFVTHPYVPDTFKIADSMDDCHAAVIVQGSFLSSGLSSGVIIPTEGFYSICAASSDGVSFVWASLVHVIHFEVRSTSVFRTRNNTLLIVPSPASYSLLSLHSTQDCTAPGYITDAVTPLAAPLGHFFVCAATQTWASPSNNTLNVYDHFVLQVPSTIRNRVAFNVSLSGGDVEVSVFSQLLLVPVGTNCNNATQTFNSVANLSATSRLFTLFLDVEQMQVTTLCGRTFDRTAWMPVSSFTVFPYAFPFSLAIGPVQQTLISGGLQTGHALLALDEQCTQVIAGPYIITQYQATDVVVPPSSATEAWYCESSQGSSGPWIAQGIIKLLGGFTQNVTLNTTGNGSTSGTITISSGNVTVLPGSDFNITVPPEVGSNPFVSPYINCSVKTDTTFGLFPVVGGINSYYICLTSPDGTLIYTDPSTAVQVSLIVTTPTIVIVGEATLLTFTPALPSSANDQIYFSKFSSCQNRVGPLSASSKQTITEAGQIFVCITPDATSFYAVSTFASVFPPYMVNVTRYVAGMPFCASLVVPDASYSLQTNGDVSNVLDSFFVSQDRSIFLSSNATGDSVCATASTSIAEKSSTYPFISHGRLSSAIGFCLDTTTGIHDQPQMLCSGTPAGTQPVNTSFMLASVVISPSTVVSDSDVSVTVQPAGIFTLKLSDINCTSGSSSFTFTTNSDGQGVMPTKDSSTSFPLPAKEYQVCSQISDQWFHVGSLTVVEPQFYRVSTTTIVVGVNTLVGLMNDLDAGHVVGVSYSPYCKNGTVAMVHSSGVTVAKPAGDQATRVSIISTNPTVIYLCAFTDVNQTILSVARLDFIDSPVQFPSAAPACTDFSLSYGGKLTEEIYVYDGACCTSSQEASIDESKVVVVAKEQTSATNTLRTITLANSDIAMFGGKLIYSLCLRNVTYCLDLGTISFSTSLCAATTLLPASQGDGPTRTNVELYAAAPEPSGSTSKTELMWIAIAFGVVLLVVIIVMVVFWQTRASKVVPMDEQKEEEEHKHSNDSTHWRRQFDEMFSKNRKEGPMAPGLTSMLQVPVDLSLNICSELPLELQELVMEEQNHRKQIVDSEEFVFDQVLRAFDGELSAAHAASLIDQKTNLLRDMIHYVEQQKASVESNEYDERSIILLDEEEFRLDLARMEGNEWRFHMSSAATRLRNELSTEPWWKSKKRRLMAGGSRALRHLDETGSLSSHSYHFDTTMPGSVPGGQHLSPYTDSSPQEQHVNSALRELEDLQQLTREEESRYNNSRTHSHTSSFTSRRGGFGH